MGYNPKFNLDPAQLEMIEDALREQVKSLVRSPDEVVHDGGCKKQAVRKVNELLAHLHHQKYWYRPKQPVPMG